MKIRMSILFAAVAMLSGCFTLYRTDYPATAVTAPRAGQDTQVQLSGFEASVTTYVPIYGYETVWHERWGRHGGLSSSMRSSSTYIPQTSRTALFLDRATEQMECAGYNLKTATPRYRVEVKFTGPVVTDGDRGVTAAWVLLSALSADYGVQTWGAKLKIYDLSTGRMVHFREFTQRYQAVVWGPLPILSPAGASDTDFNTMQSWCLTALTDLAVADATAFLSAQAN